MNRLIKHKAAPRNGTAAQISKLTSITTVLGLKDPYTREHARRVAIYACRLAELLAVQVADLQQQAEALEQATEAAKQNDAVVRDEDLTSILPHLIDSIGAR